MAAIRISRLKVIHSSVKSVAKFDIRPSLAYASKSDPSRELTNVQKFNQDGPEINGFSSSIFAQYTKGSNYKSSYANLQLKNLGFRNGLSLIGVANHRLFSSASESKGNAAQGSDVITESGGGVGGDDWVEKLKEVWQSTVGAVKYTGEKAKEVSNEASPHVQQWFDAHPYLKDVIVPVGGTLAAALLAWSLLPSFFRGFHRYSVQGPGVLLSRGSLWGPVPYENSFWSALEVPVRYFVTFMAFLEIGAMVAPDVIASLYVAQACRGGLVVSVVWFLHRWKTNVINRALAAESLERIQRNKLLTFHKISSVGLFVIGSMALAEAFGVAVQSILTVGGVGGVATAFASRDILGNVLCGLSVQLSQPFSIGDTIKAGAVEGQVVEMGLTSTSLLTAEKFPVIVPNSIFSSQVIVNKSRAKWRAMVQKIPLQIDGVDKIPSISEDIKSMLRSHSNVFLEREAPYCFLSLIERSHIELTIGCNLKLISKEAEQDILLEAVRIIKQHGAKLGCTQEDAIK